MKKFKNNHEIFSFLDNQIKKVKTHKELKNLLELQGFKVVENKYNCKYLFEFELKSGTKYYFHEAFSIFDNIISYGFIKRIGKSGKVYDY